MQCPVLRRDYGCLVGPVLVEAALVPQETIDQRRVKRTEAAEEDEQMAARDDSGLFTYARAGLRATTAVGSSWRQPIARTSAWMSSAVTRFGREPLSRWRATARRRACSIRTLRRMIENYA